MKYITINVNISIPDDDYISPSEINNFLEEDIISWFDANFYDGDSEGRVKLLSVATNYK